MSLILIVDDHEQNRYLLQTILTAAGHQFLTAENGAEALSLAREQLPDLVISDILMPQMDGFSLCRQWKHDEQLKSIPFIFYTATYTDPRDKDLGLRLGAARFIIKPMEPEEFMVIVRNVLEEYAAGQLHPVTPAEDDTVIHRLYNEALIRRLEDKMLALERANGALALEISERKRAEEQLLYDATILASINDSVIVTTCKATSSTGILAQRRSLDILPRK